MLVVYDKVAMKPRFTYLKKEVTEMQTSSATSRVFLFATMASEEMYVVVLTKTAKITQS